MIINFEIIFKRLDEELFKIIFIPKIRKNCANIFKKYRELKK